MWAGKYAALRNMHTRLFYRPCRQFTKELRQNYDAIIVGAGAMGLSCAYFLARRMNPSSICVIDRDLKVDIITINYKNIYIKTSH